MNCHQNTETADLIGGLRPIRNMAGIEAKAIREAVTAVSQFGAIVAAEDAAAITAAIDSLFKSRAIPASQESALQDLRARLQRLSAMFE